jgi:uncharacterized RDD family membrane protein YckC
MNTESLETKLDFKPVHRGLGFHPFSDGLPYTPSGATVAGPVRVAPTFTRPQPVVLRGRPLADLQTQPVAQPQPVAQTQPEAPALPSLGWVYLLGRITAFAIDLIVHPAFSMLVLMGVTVLRGHEPMVLFGAGVFEVALLFSLALGAALMMAQEVVLGSTPGKRIVGLRLRGSSAAIFMRSFFFLPSMLFMGAGIFWALFNRQRRCWHDLAADVQPLPVSRSSTG